MNEKLEKKLIEKFPKIFPPKSTSPTSAIELFGIECHDGWYVLIETACKLAQQEIDWSEKNQTEDNPKINQIVAIQIKQKFGGLRFYYSGGDKTINGIINTIEAMSYTICEECGTNQNIIHTKGYIKTICVSCEKKMKLDIP